MALIDIKEKKFGRLKVIYLVGRTKDGRILWHCRCSCGKSKDILSWSLRSGNSRSCGCFVESHGMTGTRFYNIWRGILNRCERRRWHLYKHYGARGIRLCKKWHIFSNFKKDMYSSYLYHVKNFGESQTSIYRLDSKKNYYPSNTRWATRHEQNNNTSRNVFIEYNGERKTISQWARVLNINVGTLYRRIKKSKWSINKALTTKICHT